MFFLMLFLDRSPESESARLMMKIAEFRQVEVFTSANNLYQYYLFSSQTKAYLR